MLSWQILEATGREHTEDLRRASNAAREAREARAAEAATPARRPLALDPADVYPDEPAPDRASRGRAAGRRRG